MNSQARADYVDQLRDLCVSTTEVIKLTGSNEIVAVERATDQYDLLIMGGPPARSLSTRLFGTEKDKLTRMAACSVLWLKTPRSQTHAALSVVGQPMDTSFDLMKYMSLDLIAANLQEKKKEEVFRFATEKFAKRYNDTISPIVISTALWEREQTQNTGLGNGVAMPHATLTRAAAGESAIAIFTLENEIDFAAPDEKKVDVCFFTTGPPSDRQIHLKILSSLARMALDEAFMSQLRAAQTSEAILSLVNRFCEQSAAK